LGWDPAGLRENDRRAWKRAYELHGARVYRYAFFRLRCDADAAADVTQEVFLRAIDAIRSFRGDEDALPAWLVGIARRVLAQRARDRRPGERSGGHAGARAEVPPAAAGSEPVDPGPSACERMALREEQLFTGAALAALPENYESVLRWKYCESLPVAEIAGRLRISPKAAESLLTRARAAFRTAYQGVVSDNGRWPGKRERSNE
jgi:RNA polymerase sigma-70 factor (ECF subfamily)